MSSKRIWYCPYHNKTLGNARDSKFEERLAARTDANTYNSDTNAPLETLMDEILFHVVWNFGVKQDVSSICSV